MAIHQMQDKKPLSKQDLNPESHSERYQGTSLYITYLPRYLGSV